LENDDASLRCRCGQDLPALSAATSGSPLVDPGPAPGRRILPRVAVALWWLGFLPLAFLLHAHLPKVPLWRTLIGVGIFSIPVLLALGILRRDPGRAARVWRFVLVGWALLLFPLFFTIIDGIAQEGWPRGRFNRVIAHMLTVLLGLLIPVFLTGLCALVQGYRAASGLALAAGLNHLILGIYLLRAAAPIKDLLRPQQNRLDIIAVGAKLLSYLTLPVGVLLVIGAILLFRAVRRPRAAT
jgi:hypothetical protein